MLLLISLVVAAEPWAALMAAGDCGAVLEALPNPDSSLERLAVARCAQEAGQSGRALEVLEPVQDPELLPWIAMVKGKALLERDRPEEAALVLAQARAGSETKLLRAAALVKAKRSLEAREDLRSLLEGPYGAEARWWLAEGAWDRGEQEAAVATWKAVWVKHPTSDFSEKSAKRLGDRGVLVPDFASAEGRALVMERAKNLLSLKLPERAVPLLDTIHTQDPFDTPAEQLFMAEALFDARQYKRAVEWFARAGAKDSASIMFRFALATARSGDYDGAALLYLELQEKFPGTSQAEEAAFKIPYMRYDAKDWKAAIDGFNSYLSRYSKGKFASDARWFRAWATYKSSATEQALAAFDAVIAGGGDLERQVAAKYWKARLTEDRSTLADIANRSTTGYAWFAAQRLSLPDPKLAADPSAPVVPAEFLKTHTELKLALRLVDAGLVDWARPLVQGSVKDAKAAGKSTALPVAALLLQVEDYQGAQKLAADWCGSVEARAACFPRPHQGVVQKLALEGGLHPLLPYAIMNAESGLDPSVTSLAGARGLMQLMPALAGELATDIPGFHIDQLYHAGVNARLGTRELSLLQAKFARIAVQPSLPLVIASYNGGADSVDRWLQGYVAPPDIDLFSEEISYTETRRYVRRVLAFLISYQRAYAG